MIVFSFLGALAQRFHISKYPTLKLIVNGQVAKREYRGQRSKDDIVAFIRKQLTSPVKEVTNHDDLTKTLEVGFSFSIYRDFCSPPRDKFINASSGRRQPSLPTSTTKTIPILAGLKELQSSSGMIANLYWLLGKFCLPYLFCP